MLKRYIIDSSFEFFPETCQLAILGAEDSIITLHIPVSRCLELLLERRFSLVSQRDFYHHVWPGEGKSVSADTLYQSIALLRKVLISISKEYNIMILTIPRQGFKFNQIFSVQEQMGEERIESSSNSDLLIENLTKALDQKDVANGQPIPSLQHKESTRLKGPYFHMTVILAFLITLMATYWAVEKEGLSPLAYYTRYSENSSCIIYTNSSNYDLSREIAVIQELGIDCKASPYLYITVFNYSTRVSAVSCHYPIGNDPSSVCTTYNLIGDGVK